MQLHINVVHFLVLWTVIIGVSLLVRNDRRMALIQMASVEEAVAGLVVSQ